MHGSFRAKRGICSRVAHPLCILAANRLFGRRKAVRGPYANKRNAFSPKLDNNATYNFRIRRGRSIERRTYLCPHQAITAHCEIMALKLREKLCTGHRSSIGKSYLRPGRPCRHVGGASGHPSFLRSYHIPLFFKFSNNF